MAVITIPKGTTDLSTVTVANSDGVAFYDGGQTVTAGLTAWSAFAAGLVSLYLGPRFVGNIGGAAGPLTVDVDSGAALVVNEAGGGNLYLRPGGVSSLITRLKHLGQGTTHLVGGGTVTNLEMGVMAKQINVSENVLVTNFWQSCGSSFFQWHASGANSGLQSIVVDGGVAQFERFLDGNGAGANATISGNARVIVKRENTAGSTTTLPTATDGSNGAVVRINGGVLEWWGGNMDTVIVEGDGVLDLSNAPAGFNIYRLYITAKAMARSKLTTPNGTITYDTGSFTPVPRGGKTDTLTN